MKESTKDTKGSKFYFFARRRGLGRDRPRFAWRNEELAPSWTLAAAHRTHPNIVMGDGGYKGLAGHGGKESPRCRRGTGGFLNRQSDGSLNYFATSEAAALTAGAASWTAEAAALTAAAGSAGFGSSLAQEAKNGTASMATRAAKIIFFMVIFLSSRGVRLGLFRSKAIAELAS